jgi:hypothetical protein
MDNEYTLAQLLEASKQTRSTSESPDLPVKSWDVEYTLSVFFNKLALLTLKKA